MVRYPLPPGQFTRKCLTLMSPDGKETKLLVQQTANDVDQVKRASSLTSFAPIPRPHASL
jgi:hypothetical protein